MLISKFKLYLIMIVRNDCLRNNGTCLNSLTRSILILNPFFNLNAAGKINLFEIISTYVRILNEVA